MAEGKWIAGLSPEMDLAEGARKALDQRLSTVGRCLAGIGRFVEMAFG